MSLGRAIVDAHSRALTISLALGFGGGFLLFLAGALAVLEARRIELLWPLFVLGLLIVPLATLVIAALPPYLVSTYTRRATVAFEWIGARDTRRVMGAAWKAIRVPTTPQAATAWLATTPAKPRDPTLVAEMQMLAGDLANARATIDRLPESTPLGRFRKADLLAQVAYQQSGVLDEAAARAAMAAIPDGIDRPEAAVTLAVAQARAKTVDGDWREPLAAVRPLIPESDARILARDWAWPQVIILARKVWPIVGLMMLIPLAIVVLITVR
jgi:hypothetical protein